MARSIKILKGALFDINFLTSAFCLIYVLFLAIYYGLQEQVDFRVFWTAGKEWNEGNNPYLKENQGNISHPLLNAPTSLLLYGILGKFELQTAAIIYRILCVILLLIIVVFISHKLSINFNIVFPFIALSTPFRTNLGSGQVSLLATISFIYIVLSVYKDQKIKKGAVIFALFVILTFKSYMFPAAIFFLIIKRKSYLVVFGLIAFIAAVIALEIRIKMITSWLANTSKIGGIAIDEANNSSIISILSRITNFLPLGVIVYFLINVTLLFFIINFRNEVVIFPSVLILGLVSSIYIHHQDYLLALIALIIYLSMASQKNSKLIDYFQIGLQPNSLLLHLSTYLLRVLQYHKEKPKFYSWFPILFSIATALLWFQDNINLSFLIYDSVYMFTVFLVFYKIRKLVTVS